MSFYSFGSSTYHELGFGAIDEPNVLLPTRVNLDKFVSYGTSFKQAVGGKSHIVVLTSSSSDHSLILTCGSNEKQQLGRKGSCSKLLPVEYFNSYFINQICSGTNHNLVLTDAGQVFSWGCNLFGQLGTESTLESDGQPSLIKSLGAFFCLFFGLFFFLSFFFSFIFNSSTFAHLFYLFTCLEKNINFCFFFVYST